MDRESFVSSGVTASAFCDLLPGGQGWEHNLAAGANRNNWFHALQGQEAVDIAAFGQIFRAERREQLIFTKLMIRLSKVVHRLPPVIR